MDQKTGIQEACEIMGGQAELATAVARGTGATITQQAVSRWVQQGYAPLGRVSLIVELTGVNRERLCDPRILAAVQG